MSSTDKPKIFISYRTASGRAESAYFEKKFSERGIEVLRIANQVDCPHPRGTVEEWEWFSTKLSAVIFGIPHVVVIASEGAQNSQWISWEILSSFATARCLFICWISGEDPRHWITPLPRPAYRFFPGPSAFLIDARRLVSAKPVLSIAFPNLKAKLLSAIPVCLHLLIGALVFDISRRMFQAIGFPADQMWARTLAALVGALTLVVSFPRRAVLAYKAQYATLPSTQLVYEGQTGSGIVLLVALITAILVVVAVASLHIAPTREHIGTIGIIYLFMYTAFMKLYKVFIGYPLAQINGRAVTEGAHQTAKKIDAARKAH
jgi:hypothetical protein